ncbi:forkhead-associated domain-containing protein [Phytophthora infestans]|uniref:FHA(Forkhead-associated) domain-containing protein n=1 Tax=Phytophthora infestans TaxID=4787 RepID=A0A833STV4_PHYIN|nr:forkhead-associated domain-containing protein [Phytophthora infestans]KAF4136893.1 FHA(forkhead-associated) domain-containing protein [Phytophthora infestans]KAF4136899.1 FHA(forkhead-associated) domain-containing protein [Phytophthora infestans]
MAACPPCCFRLEATRGPHNGLVLCHCRSDSSGHSSPPRTLSIGRKKRCWLRLPQDLEVSSVHAEFCFIESDMGVALRDVKSTNGTKLNGKPLQALQDYPLSNGDLIAVGRTSLRFVQVVHGQPCGEEADKCSAGASSTLTPSVSSTVVLPVAAPEVIELDEDSADDKAASKAPGSHGTPVDQPDTEPAHDELIPKPLRVVNSSRQRKEGVELQRSTSEGGTRVGAVGEYTPEEATCTVCRVVIGQLDLLEQQSHLNECLGGRVAAASATSATTSAKDAEPPKTRKRGNAGAAATRAKKSRKPKAGEDGDASATAKTKKPRKRKRAAVGEDIELALALTAKPKMSKEEQTDVQLTVTKKKLEQLDDQIAKLTKRRVNLVKTLDRLERTKEKLRKSQVLPPAKVLQLLDLKSALDFIFPSSRQANGDSRSVRIGQPGNSSTVVKQYTPVRWRGNGITIDCDEEKRAELTAVAAISMWARASQQLFGLQRDTLLYRNSILRTFLGDDDEADGSIVDLDNELEDEDGDADVEQEDEPEEKSVSSSDLPEVPDV